MINADFLKTFRRATEELWRRTPINPDIYGFQFPPGTRWNRGLSAETILEYENALGVQFPHDFKLFLGEMNGTDLATLNISGSSGLPQRESVGVYSYARNIEIVKARIDHLRPSRAEITRDFAGQGFDLSQEVNLVPISSHRCLACTSDLNSSVVLSIVVEDTDAIVYGNSLKEHLEREFLERS